MVRGILSIALVCLATASDVAPRCVLDSSDAVADGIKSALYIWASTKRCNGPVLDQAPVQCEQDLSSSIESVTHLANSIAGMVSSCGGIKEASAQCALDANRLVSATAGLAAAGGRIADDCANIVPAQFDKDVREERETRIGKCTVDAGESMNSIFVASNTLQAITHKCTKGEACTVEALDLVDVLASFGSYIAEAVEDCSAYPHKEGNADAKCAAGISASVAQLTSLAKIGLEMKSSCAKSSSRLYSNINGQAAIATTSPLTLALAAFLPITTVVSFLAGSRFAKNRQQTQTRFIQVDDQVVE